MKKSKLIKKLEAKKYGSELKKFNVRQARKNKRQRQALMY